MSKRLFLIFFIFSLTDTNSLAQTKKQILHQGTVNKKNYLIEIPFKYVNRHIFIEVLIAKRRYNFLFDTGFETNVINQNISSAIEPILRGEVKVSGSSISEEKVQLVELPKITISNLDFENSNGIIQNLDYIQQKYDSLNVDGIIGNNLMRKANWQIDYKNKLIRISDRIDSFKINKTAGIIKLSKRKWGNTYIKLFIDGKKHKFIFDLGSSGRFSTGSSFIKYLNPKTAIFKSSDDKLEVDVKNVRIGNMILGDDIISLEKGVSSLIGNAFFQDYLLTINWEDNLLYLSLME